METLGEQTQRTMQNDLKGQLTVHSDKLLIEKASVGEEGRVDALH